MFKDGFFDQIKATFAAHHEAGILLTPEPDNDQCFGGDEEPCGRQTWKESVLLTEVNCWTCEGGSNLWPVASES